MQKWTLVKGNDINNKAKNVYVEFEEWKMENKKYEEICSWLSPFHKHIASPFSPPIMVRAKNIFIGYRGH